MPMASSRINVNRRPDSLGFKRFLIGHGSCSVLSIVGPEHPRIQHATTSEKHRSQMLTVNRRGAVGSARPFEPISLRMTLIGMSCVRQGEGIIDVSDIPRDAQADAHMYNDGTTQWDFKGRNAFYGPFDYSDK